MNPISIGGYTRITKQAARKRHDAGLACYAWPCNIRPGNMWIEPAIIPGNEHCEFDKWLNAYEYYNCTNNETGRYTAFYVKEGAR